MNGTKTTRLLQLPAELRQQIYALAFFDEDDETNRFKIISKRGWIVEERDRRTNIDASRRERRAIPPCPWSRLSVCTQIYEEAICGWLHLHTLMFRDEVDLMDFLLPLREIFCASIQSIEFSWQGTSNPNYPISTIRRCANLRRVKAKVDEAAFHPIEDRFAFIDELCWDDFEALPLANELKDMQTVEQIELDIGQYRMNLMLQGEKDRWQRNVGRLQAYTMSSSRLEITPNELPPMSLGGNAMSKASTSASVLAALEASVAWIYSPIP